jgi:hypothetical protein
MNKKLQIFISSTFLDLKEEREAAVEAILKAGHIPAGMELFSSTDKQQWEVIKKWIDESDSFLLILGGRYGSIEPETGKSYIHLEYEYALKQNKHPFVLKMSNNFLEKKSKENYETYRELDNREKLKEFIEGISKKLYSEFNNLIELKYNLTTSIQTLIEDYDNELNGWVKANEFKKLQDELKNLKKNYNPNKVSYDYIDNILLTSENEDWKESHKGDLFTYKQDVKLTIKVEWTNDKFHEEWSTNHPDPSSYRKNYYIYYEQNLIKELYLVTVDGNRATLPLPEAPDLKFIKYKNYRFARIVNYSTENLDQYIRRSRLEVLENNIK